MALIIFIMNINADSTASAISEALIRGAELTVGNYMATCVSVISHGVATIKVLHGKNIPDKV